MTPWRALLEQAEQRLGDRAAARWLVEEVSGLEGAELALGLDGDATALGVARFDGLLARRLAGEPLQYVLGRWGFRRLDLMIDRRVLIPRPETETVVDVALRELDRSGGRVAAELGTGSGAIALSLAVERPRTEVWATDSSADALAVARANLAGAGRAAARVRLLEGSWFAALPAELLGQCALIVSNPPYVSEAEFDELPPEVRDWEPRAALVAGPTGLEAIEVLVAGAARWLAPGGALVVELAPHRAGAALALALAAGLDDARVEPDLTGRPRALVATSPPAPSRSGAD